MNSILILLVLPTDTSISETDARQEHADNDDDSDVIGIVAGSVAAFVVIVVTVSYLITFLVWYCANQKRDYTMKSGLHVYCVAVCS